MTLSVKQHLDAIDEHTRSLMGYYFTEDCPHRRAKEVRTMLQGILDRVMQVGYELGIPNGKDSENGS